MPSFSFFRSKARPCRHVGLTSQYRAVIERDQHGKRFLIITGRFDSRVHFETSAASLGACKSRANDFLNSALTSRGAGLTQSPAH